MEANLTVLTSAPQWNSEPMFHMHPWGEPLIIFSILCAAMIATRRRKFQIFGRHRNHWGKSILDDEDLEGALDTADELLEDEYKANDDDSSILNFTSHQPPKSRRCCGCTLYTPNSSRFANHLHSRVLQKFPFLIEMFYWIITYLFYRMTKVVSQAIFTKSIIDVAQSHGLAVLELEQFSSFSFLFPWREYDVQRWFMQDHQTALTVLNRAYALIHIPGTVGFIAWYYATAQSFETFATVRRTLTLTNMFAFMTFTLYPCMPPRLLPPEYGFLDSVRHDNATSIWMSGDFVNSLAAMPSMHFGYAFVIGATLLHHSRIFRIMTSKDDTDKLSWRWAAWYVVLGLAYPGFILVTIVATANHYWLDALMAAVVAGVAYAANGVFIYLLPLEDVLLWVLRAAKPTATTGLKY